jgi:hypothetical protein
MSCGNRKKMLLRAMRRYGLLTSDAARELLGCSAKACERLISALLRDGFIAAYRFHGARKYYVLTVRGGQLVDLEDATLGRPFSAQGLCQNLAAMAFCLLGEKHFERMERAEFKQNFPQLVHGAKLGRSNRTRYYLDTTEEKVRLGLMVYDFGAETRRIVDKAIKEVNRRAGKSSEFADIVAGKLFSITVLTAFCRKAERIARQLEKVDFHSRCVVVPELGRFFVEEPQRDQ